MVTINKTVVVRGRGGGAILGGQVRAREDPAISAVQTEETKLIGDLR